MAAGKHINRLSARKVKTLSEPGLYPDGANLYLKISDGGAKAKSWIYRHDIGRKTRKYGLGPLHTVSLSDARVRAEETRRMLRAGVDPKAERRAKQVAAAVADAKTIDFNTAAETYIEAHKPSWRNPKHSKQWSATLKTYASPVFGRLPVSAIDTGMVMRVLQPIWVTKTETAGRVRGRIERVLDWAKVQGYRDGPNPALWRGHLDHLLPARSKVQKVEHHAALAYDQVPAFMIELRKRQGVAALALEFTVLCAVRTSETLNAAWSEFDLGNKLWVIPAERMKGDREHRVPLCNRAVAIVESMKNPVVPRDWVFPGHLRGRPLSNMALLTVLRRMKRALTTHGFRASFKTWATEQTHFPREVIEVALAHVIGGAVEQAYQRGDLLDKRRRLMDAWAAYCSKITTGKVIPMGAIKHR